jgi:hypothetical protein
MSKNLVLSLLNFYEKKLEEMNIQPIEADFDDIISGKEKEVTLGHCRSIIPQIRILVTDGQGLRSTRIRDHVYRQLGFVQGVMWSEGIYSINQMLYCNISK